jgi:TonB family protein
LDAVTQIVTVRRRDSDGVLPRMLGASVVAHVGLIAVVAFAPASWFGATVHKEPENVMTISLSGAPGPRETGMTMLGGRPVQQVVEAAKPVEAVRPPAARAPEMIEPVKTAPKKAESKIDETIKDARSRVPTKGEEIRKGSAIAETGARGQGFGLSSGGGGTGSTLDTADFCCPEYIAMMVELIRRNWDDNQQASGRATVKFTIQRDGRLTDIMVEKSTGYATLDGLASRALILTKQLPPLPAAFTPPSLTVHLVFEYQR